MLNCHLRSNAARAVFVVLVTAFVAASTPAFAQTGPETALPAAEADVPRPGTATPVPAATPAREMLQKNPAKTKEVVDKAGLTPIVPSPDDPFKPAFQLYSEIDIPVLAVGTVFAAARLFRTQRAYCAPLCDKSELNDVDRITAGRYDTNWGLASDFGLYALAGGTGLLLAIDEGVPSALNDGVVIAQSALLATAISSTLTLSTGRPRPLLYGTKAPESVRNSADAGNSFISSHTSVSFAIATSTWMAMRRLHPNTAAPTLTLVVGLTLASFVGVSRVMAGKHFITDAVGGGIVGASTGILVPALHSTPVKVVPQLKSDTKGVAAVGHF